MGAIVGKRFYDEILHAKNSLRKTRVKLDLSQGNNIDFTVKLLAGVTASKFHGEDQLQVTVFYYSLLA